VLQRHLLYLGEINSSQERAWRKSVEMFDERTEHSRSLALFTGSDPTELWCYYIQLTQVEEAFRNLKGDLAIWPIYHQKEARIEAHIFIAFLAYCLHVTLARQLRAHAPGLTPRSVLEKFAAVQMIDVEIPTTDGRTILLTRYTEPQPELKLLLERLRLELPAQPPPKISPAQAETATPCSADLWGAAYINQ